MEKWEQLVEEINTLIEKYEISDEDSQILSDLINAVYEGESENDDEGINEEETTEEG